MLDHKRNEHVVAGVGQWRSQPKNLEGGKKFGRAKMLDFRRITLFCLEKRLSKHEMAIFSKKLGVHSPFGPPCLRLWCWKDDYLQWLIIMSLLKLRK